MSEAFPACMREIYKCTHKPDRKLRDVVGKTAQAHLARLRTMKPFKELAYDDQDFVVDLTQRFASPEDMELTIVQSTCKGMMVCAHDICYRILLS
jgi:hypothetical protein